MSIATKNVSQSFPALEEMGITRAYEISSYSLRTIGADRDVLKIRYKRAKGSLLPASRTYKFGRSLKTVIADGGTARMEHTYEISPFLLTAVAELDSLVVSNNAVKEKADAQLDEQQRIELLGEFDAIEAMLGSEPSDANAAAIAARFARLKAQVASL